MTNPVDSKMHAGGVTVDEKDGSVASPTSNGDLASLIGRNGLTVIGAVTFLLSIPSNTLPSEFAKLPILYGYGLVCVISICGYVVLGGFEKIDRKSVAGFMLLIAVACIFATPPLFAIWDSARQRAPDASLAPTTGTPPVPTEPAAAPPPTAAANTLRPFSLEVTQR